MAFAIPFFSYAPRSGDVGVAPFGRDPWDRSGVPEPAATGRDGRGELTRIERLFEKRGGQRLGERPQPRGEGAAAYEHESASELGLGRDDALVHLHTREVWHHEVADDDIEAPAVAEEVGRLGPGVDNRHIMRGENLRDDIRHVRLVIDDEHAGAANSG